jgi:ribonuclease P protein component
MPNQVIKYTLPKRERLCSKLEIAHLFNVGKKIKAFPLQLTYAELPHSETKERKVVFLASKRIFNRAHKRNKAKRRLREIYRLNKHQLYEALPSNNSYAISISLASSKEISYSELENQFQVLLDLLRREIETNTN